MHSQPLELIGSDARTDSLTGLVEISSDLSPANRSHRHPCNRHVLEQDLAIVCVRFALIAPEPPEAHRGTQFKGPGLLLLCNGDSGEKCFLGWRLVRRIALQQDLAEDAVQVSVGPMLSRLLRQPQRLVK